MIEIEVALSCDTCSEKLGRNQKHHPVPGLAPGNDRANSEPDEYGDHVECNAEEGIALDGKTDLLKFHGVDADKAVSKGGRVELQLKSTPVYLSALHRLVDQTKAKLLIYDSLSAPLKSTFPSTQDLPARSSSLAMLLSHAQRLCIEFGISVLTTSHVSIDPINAWDRRPYGGIVLGHDAKFSFELTKSDATRNSKGSPVPVNPEDQPAAASDGRAVWVQRHPAMADYSQYGFSMLDKEGFH